MSLAEGLKLCESIEELGLDGLSVAEIASALGYTNIKTNTFSARLSASRQFGLLHLSDEGYSLTPLARAILHPVDPDDCARLRRQALLTPPLYAELATQFGGKRVPDAGILGNVLYHNHQIIASAKNVAAEAFLESARFAGTLGEDQVLRPDGQAPPPSASRPGHDHPESAHTAKAQADVRLDLRLWDKDEGKVIRVRAPQAITVESFERFLQAFRLLVRIEGACEARSKDKDPRTKN